MHCTTTQNQRDCSKRWWINYSALFYKHVRLRELISDSSYAKCLQTTWHRRTSNSSYLNDIHITVLETQQYQYTSIPTCTTKLNTSFVNTALVRVSRVARKQRNFRCDRRLSWMTAHLPTWQQYDTCTWYYRAMSNSTMCILYAHNRSLNDITLWVMSLVKKLVLWYSTVLTS